MLLIPKHRYFQHRASSSRFRGRRRYCLLALCPNGFSGKELAKIIAIVGAVNGIAPVAAPVIGGSVANLIGWRGIFYILLGIGVVITAIVIPVKETLPKDAREQGAFLRSFEGFILVC